MRTRVINEQEKEEDISMRPDRKKPYFLSMVYSVSPDLTQHSKHKYIKHPSYFQSHYSELASFLFLNQWPQS